MSNAAAYRHGPHFDHLPSEKALVVGMGLLMPVAFQLQVENVIHGLLVSCLCFTLPFYRRKDNTSPTGRVLSMHHIHYQLLLHNLLCYPVDLF